MGPMIVRVARHVSQRAHYISLVQRSNNVHTCWAEDNDLAPDVCRTIVYRAKHQQEDRSTGWRAARKLIKVENNLRYTGFFYLTESIWGSTRTACLVFKGTEEYFKQNTLFCWWFRRNITENMWFYHLWWQFTSQQWLSATQSCLNNYILLYLRWNSVWNRELNPDKNKEQPKFHSTLGRYFVSIHAVHGSCLVTNGTHKNCHHHKSDLRVWNDED